MDASKLEALKSKAPNERAKVANWLQQHPYEIPTPDLMRALQFETVPQIRRALNNVLEARQRRREDSKPSKPESSMMPVVEPSLDIAALIRHELSPAIGWIRLAGDKEIGEFEKSETDRAVKKLQRRIDGLIALIKQAGDLNLQRICLVDALVECWPDPASRPRVRPEIDPQRNEISTDSSLFTLLMSNIYQNAIDASRESEGSPSVDVSWGVTSERFWVRISNPFVGAKFTLADILQVGVSTKAAHQGHGVALIVTVASRLDLDFDIFGSSGLAAATLSGKISVV
ncbi:GHKL domain-containing protein [Paenarthrobacter sp. CAP02]|uniref:GHKL domain-containing protein n=1 Tax=Paenarthrobacter sp. CAP02 TaxID=3158144 RepID=UPI0032DB46C9